ncbi:MAG: GxxExxY protein [Anaerolineales bacterium]|nr:GxxExxY protein [Anaerolineales bacterium]
MDSRTQKASVFAPIPPEVERVAKIVLDAAFKVHTALGPGLLESVYETCHAYEIRESGLLVETQAAIPVTYRNIRLEGGLRLDWLSHQFHRAASQRRHQADGGLRTPS